MHTVEYGSEFISLFDYSEYGRITQKIRNSIRTNYVRMHLEKNGL